MRGSPFERSRPKTFADWRYLLEQPEYVVETKRRLLEIQAIDDEFVERVVSEDSDEGQEIERIPNPRRIRETYGLRRDMDFEVLLGIADQTLMKMT